MLEQLILSLLAVEVLLLMPSKRQRVPVAPHQLLACLPLVVLAAVCLVLGLFPDRLTALFQSLAAQVL